MEKYGYTGNFNDPVVRCDSCQRLLLMRDLVKTGRCWCGNRQVRNIFRFTLFEYLKMRFVWRVDRDWLGLFSSKAKAA